MNEGKCRVSISNDSDIVEKFYFTNKNIKDFEDLSDGTAIDL